MVIKRDYKYNLKLIKSKSPYYHIRLRVSYHGFRLDVNTRTSVMKLEDWDEETHRVKKGALSRKKVPAAEQNLLIARTHDTLEECFKFYEVENRIPTPDELKIAYDHKLAGDVMPGQKVSKRRAFWDIYEEYLSVHGQENSWTKNTYKQFNVLRNILQDYKSTIRFSDIDEDWLTGFLIYLRDEKKTVAYKSQPDENGSKKEVKVGLTNTTIKKKLGYLKMFLNWASTKGYNTNMAFLSFKPKLKNTQKTVIYLTREELQRVVDLKLPVEKRYLDRVRDIFLFCCFSGLRYSDVQNLKKSDIRNGKIEVTTIKTADSISIELNDITRMILEKYSALPLKNNLALPVISLQNMNVYLKELCKMAEINEMVRITQYKGNKRIDTVKPKWELVGTHVGRRTFITTMLSQKTSAEIIMRWTGHASYSSMKPYIAVVDEAKETEMQKVNDWIKM